MSEQKQTHSDALSQYLDLRTEYVDQLREHDLVDENGRLREAVVNSLLRGDTTVPADGTGIYPEGSPLAKHCREHPNDPLCQRVRPDEMVREFLDVRSAFLDDVAEHGLEDVQQFFAGLMGGPGNDQSPVPMPFGGAGNAGLIGPDGDIDDIPPRLRPYVNVGRFDGKPQPLPFDLGTLANEFAGSVGNVGLVTPDQGLDGIPPWLWPYVTPGGYGSFNLFPGGFGGFNPMIGRSARLNTALLY